MPLRPPRALLLDLDDTILAYAPLADPIWERLTAAFAPGLDVAPALLLDTIRKAGRRYWGEPERSRAGRHDMRGARRRICLWAFRELSLPELVGAALADAFHDAREAAVAPLPGALDALEQMRSRDLPLALVTNGGRVLNVTARASDIPSTIKKAYSWVKAISFDGPHYRRDIGKKALP